MTDDRQVLISPYGDSALLVDFGQPSKEERWSRSQALGRALTGNEIGGILDFVASFDTVFVSYDPLSTDYGTVESAIRRRLAHSELSIEPRTFHIPVVYGGERGPDLDDVAHEQGISPNELIRMHSGCRWTVRFRGAPAAAPMCDDAPWEHPVARSTTPRLRIPPGSIAVSGHQNVVYTVPSPGGWRILGQTPVQLMDIHETPIALYGPGDVIRFVPISDDDWNYWQGPLADLDGKLNREFGADERD